MLYKEDNKQFFLYLFTFLSEYLIEKQKEKEKNISFFFRKALITNNHVCPFYSRSFYLRFRSSEVPLICSPRKFTIPQNLRS